MSADNWAYCPGCQVESVLVQTGPPTLREDYGIWGAETGTVHVEYSGRCTECGLSLSFETKEDFPL